MKIRQLNLLMRFVLLLTVINLAACGSDEPTPDPVAQWLGTWQVSEVVTPANGTPQFTDTYSIIIARTALEGKLSISNFGGVNATATASILSNSLSIDVNPVTTPSGATYKFTGSLTPSGSANLFYQAFNGSNQLLWSATGAATK